MTADERKECRLSVMISRSLCCLASTLRWSMEHNFSNLALQFLHFTAGSWEAVARLPRMQVAEHRAAVLHLWTFCIHILPHWADANIGSFILGQPPPLFISHFTTSVSKRQYADSYVHISLNTQTGHLLLLFQTPAWEQPLAIASDRSKVQSAYGARERELFGHKCIVSDWMPRRYALL